MTKKAPSFSIRHVFWFGWKLVILVSVALCVLALLRLQSNSELSSISLPPQGPRFYRVSVYQGNPKIAFLFLVRRSLPLDFLWGSFFEVLLRSLLEFSRESLEKVMDSKVLWCLDVGVCRTWMRRIFRFIFIRSLGLCLMKRRRGPVFFTIGNWAIAFR